jgi:hypothetical protein
MWGNTQLFYAKQEVYIVTLCFKELKFYIASVNPLVTKRTEMFCTPQRGRGADVHSTDFWSQYTSISAGIATSLHAGLSRNRCPIPGRGKTFSVLYGGETDSGVHLTSYPKDTMAVTPGVKCPGSNAEHSPQCVA